MKIFDGFKIALIWIGGFGILASGEGDLGRGSFLSFSLMMFIAIVIKDLNFPEAKDKKVHVT